MYNEMSYYDFLAAAKERGELGQWYQIGLPSHLANWMEYYSYYLEHPEKSYFQLSLPEYNPNCKVDPIDMLAGQVRCCRS